MACAAAILFAKTADESVTTALSDITDGTSVRAASPSAASLKETVLAKTIGQSGSHRSAADAAFHLASAGSSSSRPASSLSRARLTRSGSAAVIFPVASAYPQAIRIR